MAYFIGVWRTLLFHYANSKVMKFEVGFETTIKINDCRRDAFDKAGYYLISKIPLTNKTIETINL